MGKERDSNHAETRHSRQEEIRHLTDELRQLQDLYEQGQIDEEHFFVKRGPLVRRRLELTDLERKEKAAQHRDWFLAGGMGFKNLSAELEELRGWSQERREGLRQQLEDQIDKYAPEDRLYCKWRSQFIEEIDSLDPWASLHFLRLIFHYLRMTSQLYEDIPKETRKNRKEARAIYRLHGLKISVLEHLKEVGKGTVEDLRKALNKSPSEVREALRQLEEMSKVECVPVPTGGRPKKFYELTHREGPVTPTDKFTSMVVRFDEEGEPDFKMPGDRTGRPPKTPETGLIFALFELLQLLGDARKDIYKDLRNILAAFCWINLSIERIKKIVEPHPSDSN